MLNRLITALALLAAPATAQPPPPDTLLLNGQIFTADGAAPLVEALAITGGRITARGRNAEISALAGPATRIIDLNGRAATPGLIDTHAHILSTGLAELNEIPLGAARSVADVVAAVKARVATTPPGQWVQGAGWDEGKFSPVAYPTAADLDAVSPDNPVWLENTTGHYGVANSAALRLAGITAATPAPPAGTIERLADGRPAGVLKESAQELVTRLIPPPSPHQRRQAIAHMIRRLHAEGMTGFKDPAIGPDDWAAYRDLARAGQLPINACVLFAGGRTMASATRALAHIKAAQADHATLGATTLNLCGVKLFMDGSGAAPTAWMYRDWNRNRTDIAAGNRGYPQIEPDVFRQMVSLFVNQGIGIGTHAIGDRAIDWTVDIYARALAGRAGPAPMLTIIHANTPTDHAITQMATLQARHGAGYPESQATFAWWIGDIYAANLGHERSQRLNPFATYVQRGVRWGGGSDSSVTPFPARLGLWASVAREPSGGTWGKTPFGTAESVAIATALLSYTTWAAPLIAAPASGTLAVGKSADIAIWNQNPLTIPTPAIKDIKADMTLFQGRIVHERQ